MSEVMGHPVGWPPVNQIMLKAGADFAPKCLKFFIVNQIMLKDGAPVDPK